MGGKSAPPPPDYTAAAEKTADSSKEVTNMQTWANRADQVSPWGSTRWGTQDVIDPATGQHVTKWTQNTDVSPELQNALSSQLGLQTSRSQLASSLMPRAQQEFGQQMDWSQLTPWAQGQMNAGNLRTTTNPYGFGDPRASTPALQNRLDYSGLQDVQGSNQSRQQAADAIYQQATSRLDPQWAGQEQQLQTQLANQGITENSAAYQNAMAGLQRQKTDAYQQAMMGAVTGAGAEAQRNQAMDLGLRQQQAAEAGNQGQFGNAAQQAAYQQALQAGQFGLSQQQQAFGQRQAAGSQNFSQQMQANQYQNQMRQQQLTEAMQQRGFSLNEINAIISGQQVGMPQFAGYNTAQASQAVDYSGAAKNQYQAGMDATNAANQSTSNLISGVAGAAMMFSDRRVKRDIRRIAKHRRGFGIYSYRYVGERGPRVGVIAQEVRRYVPEAVHSLRGVLMVDYAAI